MLIRDIPMVVNCCNIITLVQSWGLGNLRLKSMAQKLLR